MSLSTSQNVLFLEIFENVNSLKNIQKISKNA